MSGRQIAATTVMTAERVVGRRGVLDGEAVREVGARDHDARVEAREQRRDRQHSVPTRAQRERPPAPAAQTKHREASAAMRSRAGQKRRGRRSCRCGRPRRDRPDQEAAADGQAASESRARPCLRALAQIADRAHRQIGRAVEGEQEHERDPAEHGVAGEEIPEAAGEVAARVDRDPVRRSESPMPQMSDDRRCCRRCSPSIQTRRQRGLSLFSRHSNETTRMIRKKRIEQQREVEAREHRPVPGRERREGRAARDDEPDLVPVPDRPDRLEHRPPLALVARQERQQHPDAEVEALEHEVAAPQDGDQDEPEILRGSSVGHRRRVEAPGSSASAGPGRA